MNTNSTVGNIMQEGRARTIKGLVIATGMLVYLFGVVYGEVHGWSLLSKGVEPDMLIWAGLGIVSIGLSALALPLALHFWTYAPAQRYAAFAFYFLDLAILGLNAAADFDARTGLNYAAWQVGYVRFMVPATPVIAIIGWSLLFLLDPASKAMATRETLKTAIQEALSGRIIEAANNADITVQVDQAARLATRDIVRATLGVQVDTGTTSHHEPTSLPLQAPDTLPADPDDPGRTRPLVPVKVPAWRANGNDPDGPDFLFGVNGRE